MGSLPESNFMTLQHNESLHDSRQQFASKVRRIIWNNDGNDLAGLGPGEEVTEERFLAARFDGLAGSQVDAVSYCTGVFNHYSHRSEVSELLCSDLVPSRRLHELHALGTDSLELASRHCRRHGRDIFWSMRMNDTHDSGVSAHERALFTHWKRRHPDCLIAADGTEPPYAAGRWSALDYGCRAVREQVLRIIEDVLLRYDIDGVELDFFRHPHYFRPQFYGEKVREEDREMMSELIAGIRNLIDQFSAAAGRPLLVLVRVPDSLGYCGEIGLDLARWVRSGWVDLVIGGGYFHLQPWGTFCPEIRAMGASVHACLDGSRLESSENPEAASQGESLWECEAALAWQSADGIYLFNRFRTTQSMFRRFGDPTQLPPSTECARETAIRPGSWATPQRWLKGGDAFLDLPI